MPRRVLAALVIAPFAACSLVESFDGYSDDWRRDAGGGSGGASGWPGTGGGAGAAASGGSGGAVDAATEACAPAREPCASGCADLSSDPANCGACGVDCGALLGPLSVCSGGECSCPSGTVNCQNRCTRLDSDPLNCGGCEDAVDPAEYCVNGVATCRPRTSPCVSWTTTGGFTVSCTGYPKCTDTDWDGSHCVGDGGGKSRCYATASDVGRCIDGDCEYNGACPAGRIECSSTLSNVKSCFDPDNDSNHCGACFNGCAADETCVQGQCARYFVVAACSECPAPSTCCSALPAEWAHSALCVEGSACPE